MPWPETTVPKFGDWDGNEDLSYSIVFDKARADKERFMPGVKNNPMDSSLKQESYKIPGLIPGNTAPHIIRNRMMETRSRESEHNSPKLSSKYSHRSANEQKASQSIQEGYTDTSDRGSVFGSLMPSSRQQRMQMVQTKDLMAREMGANGSHCHAPGRVQRVPGPIRQTYQDYPAGTKTTGSHECSETSSIADLAENIVVPKFGDWDVNGAKAAEGFTVIFDRARDEKKSKVAHKTPARFVSPLRPAEDLYKGSQPRKKKTGWLCCAAMGE